MTHHLVGLTEIARMLGVSRQRASQLVAGYDDFPLPEAELSMGRIWGRTAVEQWITVHPERKVGRPGRPERRGRRGGGRERGLFTRFTSDARQVVVVAQEEARRLQHNYIGTEHLLLGVLRDGSAGADVLAGLGVTVDESRDHLIEMIGEGDEAPTGHIPFTPRSKKVLELSHSEALARKQRYIGTEHILLALVRESDGVAWQILEKFGLTSAVVREAVAKLDEDEEPAASPDLLQSLEERIADLERRLADDPDDT